MDRDCFGLLTGRIPRSDRLGGTPSRGGRDSGRMSESRRHTLRAVMVSHAGRRTRSPRWQVSARGSLHSGGCACTEKIGQCRVIRSDTVRIADFGDFGTFGRLTGSSKTLGVAASESAKCPTNVDTHHRHASRPVNDLDRHLGGMCVHRGESNRSLFLPRARSHRPSDALELLCRGVTSLGRRYDPALSAVIVLIFAVRGAVTSCACRGIAEHITTTTRHCRRRCPRTPRSRGVEEYSR